MNLYRARVECSQCEGEGEGLGDVPWDLQLCFECCGDGYNDKEVCVGDIDNIDDLFQVYPEHRAMLLDEMAKDEPKKAVELAQESVTRLLSDVKRFKTIMRLDLAEEALACAEELHAFAMLAAIEEFERRGEYDNDLSEPYSDMLPLGAPCNM